jgi:hypothetical protein
MTCSSLCHKDETCSVSKNGVCVDPNKKIYAVKIKFNDKGFWSKAYTYTSFVRYAPDSIVVVPTNSFYSIGKVSECLENYNFKEDIKYKKVITKLEF